jgi:multiple sugar transport system substrate-binding protein
MKTALHTVTGGGRTRRGFVRALGALAASGGAVGAAACAPLGQGGGPATPEPMVTINFYHQWPADAATGQTAEKMVAKFKQQFPNTNVTTTFGGTQPAYEEKLTAIAAGGDFPDVFNSSYDSTPAWVKRGVVISPETVAKGSTKFDKNDLVPAARDAVTYDGKLMAMPYILTPAAISFNQTAFRQNGLDPNKPPTTWDEMVEMGRRLTGGAGDAETWGWQVATGTQAGAVNHWLAFLWQNGGDTVDYNRRAPIWNSEAGVQALQFWVDAVHRHRIASLTPPANAFQIGRVAMQHLYPGGIETAKQRIGNQFDWTTAVLPKQKQQACILGGHALLVGNTKRNHERAWQFVHWYSTPSNIVEWNVQSASPPPWKSAEQHPMWQQYIKDEPRMKAFVSMIPFGHPPERLSTWGQCQTLIGQAKDDALNLRKSPKQALDDAAREAEPLLKNA